MKVKKKKIIFFFFSIWEFLSQIWEKHLIFALGIGAEIRPQNRPRKIPDVDHNEIPVNNLSVIIQNVIPVFATVSSRL